MTDKYFLQRFRATITRAPLTVLIRARITVEAITRIRTSNIKLNANLFEPIMQSNSAKYEERTYRIRYSYRRRSASTSFHVSENEMTIYFNFDTQYSYHMKGLNTQSIIHYHTAV